MPPYSPGVIANEFLKRSGRDGKPVTPMQLQKLVFLAHGWNLGVNEEPLINEEIEAWDYGPVVPSLFHEFKRFGGSPITKLAYEPVAVAAGSTSPELDFDSDAPFLPDDDNATAELIDWIWEEYGTQSGWQLSVLTHKPGAPWKSTVQSHRGVRNPVIADDLIRDHYTQLWAKRDDG